MIDDVGYQHFVKHIKALAFWDANKISYQANGETVHLKATDTWHFDPRQFIKSWRRCGWLSHNEMAQMFPRYLFYDKSDGAWRAINSSIPIYNTTVKEAEYRIRKYWVSMNKCLSKYLIYGGRRKAQFLAQVMLETAQWRNNPALDHLIMHEWGFGEYNKSIPNTKYYGDFYGRGIMQLTWAGNYLTYGVYRAFSKHHGPYSDKLTPDNPRITKTSKHWTADPDSPYSKKIVWSPRYDPEIVASVPYNACDSGGFYWVHKHFSGERNINRVADKKLDASSVGKVSWLVNGGYNGYFERQAYAAFNWRLFSDNIDNKMTVSLTTPKGQIIVDFTKAKQ